MMHSKLCGLAVVAALAVATSGKAMADAPEPLTPDRAAELKRLILPQEGENPFWRVAWLSDIWEARQQAAAEGKPIFVWGGSEGAPITNC
jgi:hypothetical protein